MLYSCPYCNHRDASLYRGEQRLRDGGQRDIYQCNECGSLYPSQRMDSSEAEAYNNRLNTNQKAGTDYSHYYDNAVEYIRYDDFICKLLKRFAQPVGEALDIGAFLGRFCRTLEYIGFNAYGLEPQENAAQFARNKGVRVFNGFFPDNIPSDLLNMRFTLISMMESIYYFIDLKKSLLRVNEMLRNGGFFLIQCHQGKSKYYSKKENSFFKRYGDYVQAIPTMDSLKYCLENTGFEILYAAPMPVDFIRIIYKGSRFKWLTIKAGALLNKLYELFMADIESADKLIVLARKRGDVKDV